MKWLSFLLTAFFLCGFNPILADQQTDRKQITAVIDDSIGWFKTKNIDRLYEIFPDDPNLFLFHPDFKDTVIGGKAFRDGSELLKNPDSIYLSHEIRDLRINLSKSGTVAWWSAFLDDCGSYGGAEFCRKDCRWTGVMEKREGKWVVVQAHFSLAADKVAEEIRAAGSQPAEEFEDYAAMRQRLGVLFAQKKYAAATTLLKAHLDKFPDNLMANITNLSIMALMQMELEKAVYWLEEGHRRGLFFSKWAFLGEMWRPLGGHERYTTVLAENEKRVALAQSQARMKLELVKPQNYNPKRKYPLFIALHGGGENLDDFRPRWTSPRLKKEFVIAYVQSSQVADMKGFHWQDDGITKKELLEAFQEIQAQVAIDPRQIFIGGFSSGGYGTMVAINADIFPARGFIILCPELPADLAPETLASLRKRKMTGTLLTTELDQRIERQKAFVTNLNAAGVPVQLVVTPNIGHWYPENLSQLIDQALSRLKR